MKRSRKRVIWFLGLTGVVLLVLGLVTHQRSPQSEFVRHVSPPLPDGTRYTFLYPSRLDHVSMQSKLLIRYDDSAPLGLTSWQVWLLKLHLLTLPPHGPRWATTKLTALVNPLSRNRPLSPAARRLPARRVESKSSKGWLREHNVLIFDFQSGYSFQLNLLLFNQNLQQRTREADTIYHSFRILRPGESAE